MTDLFIHQPDIYVCEQFLPIDALARSERFLGELEALKDLGYRDIGGIKKVSQVDAAISVGKVHLAKLDSPSVGRVIYCTFWNDEIWTEFHCAKIHHELDLLADVSVTNLRVNGATGIFMAIELAQAYLAANPDRGVLVVAADKIDARFVRRKFSGGLFGDGAAAAFLSAQPVNSGGLWVSSAPKFEIDGRFYNLDTYEEDVAALHDASSQLQTRLIDRLKTDTLRSGDAVFLSQPGARFSQIESHSALRHFTGNWSRRGYLPASGLMHVIADFLGDEDQSADTVIMGEASVGLQYAGVIGSLNRDQLAVVRAS